MDRFLEKATTPVPIPLNATPVEEQAIIAGNIAFRKLVSSKKQRERVSLQPRIKWSEKERFHYGRMAAQSTTAAALKEAKKIHPLANESTIRNFRKQYLLTLTKDHSVSTAATGKLPTKQRGRPLLFGVYDKLIVNYVRRLRKHGAKVNTAIVMGTARGIIVRKAPQLLSERGGAKKITRNWARSLLRRIKYAKRKGIRKSKKFLGDEQAVADQFHHKAHSIITKYNIPPALVIAADEQFSKILPVGNWTLEEQGTSQVELVGIDDKRGITLFLMFTGDLTLLGPQVI